jgi:hypothetical protein
MCRVNEYKMKPLPPPEVPGDTPWERFDNACRKIIAVPKEAFVKEEAKRKRARERKWTATENESKQ